MTAISSVSDRACRSCICAACALIYCCPEHRGEEAKLPPFKRGTEKSLRKWTVSPNRCNTVCATGQGAKKMRHPLVVEEKFVTNVFGLKMRNLRSEAEEGKKLCPSFVQDEPLTLMSQVLSMEKI